MRVVTALSAAPLGLDAARRPETAGGLPNAPGFYAWWLTPGGLPGIPRHPHPNPEVGLDLLYVGIAPKGPPTPGKPVRTVRDRVLKDHLGGNTGSSTFRLSLASLLMVREGYEPTTTKTKCVLTRQDNARLSAWQNANLALTWCEVAEPWRIEDSVIEAMEPPLNLADNSAHPFYAAMGAARALFRSTARSR